MLYLLDTNAFSELAVDDSLLEGWIAALPDGAEVATCTIVEGEILFGIRNLPEGKRRAALELRTVSLFEIVPCKGMPGDAGQIYADLKAARFRKGLAMEDNDLWIAACALGWGAVLVTRDSDFAGIEGLKTLRFPM